MVQLLPFSRRFSPRLRLRWRASRSPAAGSGCLPGPVHGLFPRTHPIRPALLLAVVRRPPPGPAGRAPDGPGAVHPVDAGNLPPVPMSPTWARSTVTVSCGMRRGHQNRPGPAASAVGRAIDRAVADRRNGPVLLNRRGARMDRHAATRRLRQLARQVSMPYQFRCRGGLARCPDRRPAR
jgi:hypothetical protein